MFALGCVQSVSCATPTHCPTGVATQDKLRQAALVVPDMAERVYNFHRLTLKALAQMLAAAGLDHPDQVKAHHLARRLSATEIKPFSQLHIFLEPGQLIDGTCKEGFFAENWERAVGGLVRGLSSVLPGSPSLRSSFKHQGTQP